MMIIKIEANKNGQHLFQTQSHRRECWLDDYIAVPENLESAVMSCKGYCDLTIKNNRLIEIQPRPDLIPVEEVKPSELEQLRADVDFLSIMTGVSL